MSKYIWALGAALTLGLVAPLAAAQGNSRLAAAQKAYADVDYESARGFAKAAIEGGGNDRATTSDLYLLWGTAAAALDQADEARSAFQYALASNPELKLDRGLSPKIRAPYQEARGALVSSDGKPPLDVALLRRRQGLEISLRDTLQVAARVVLATREGERHSFTRQMLDAAPARRVPTPHEGELFFFLQVLDRHGNVLLEQGTENRPQRLALVTSTPALASVSTKASPSSDHARLPYYVTAGALAAVGLGLGGFATAMYVKREDAAKEWNGASCERPGSSRRAQCGDVDDRRRRAEHLSIGLAAGSGALLLGSVVSLLLTPSSARPVGVAVYARPDSLFLHLDTPL